MSGRFTYRKYAPYLHDASIRASQYTSSLQMISSAHRFSTGDGIAMSDGELAAWHRRCCDRLEAGECNVDALLQGFQASLDKDEAPNN